MNKILLFIILTFIIDCFRSQNMNNSSTNTSSNSTSSTNNLNTNSSTSSIAGGLGINLALFTVGVDSAFNITCLTISPNSSNDCISRSNSNNKCCYSYGKYLNQTTQRCIPLFAGNTSTITKTLLDFSSNLGISDAVFFCSGKFIASNLLYLYFLYLLFFD